MLYLKILGEEGFEYEKIVTFIVVVFAVGSFCKL